MYHIFDLLYSTAKRDEINQSVSQSWRLNIQDAKSG